MVQDVPNTAFVIGYTNASWTLGADNTSQRFCKLVQYMNRKRFASMTPSVPKGLDMKATNVMNLNSTYVERAKGYLPRAGDKAPWKPRSNYMSERWALSWGDLVDGLQFDKFATSYEIEGCGNSTVASSEQRGEALMDGMSFRRGCMFE